MSLYSNVHAYVLFMHIYRYISICIFQPWSQQPSLNLHTIFFLQSSHDGCDRCSPGVCVTSIHLKSSPCVCVKEQESLHRTIRVKALGGGAGGGARWSGSTTGQDQLQLLSTHAHPSLQQLAEGETGVGLRIKSVGYQGFSHGP